MSSHRRWVDSHGEASSARHPTLEALDQDGPSIELPPLRTAKHASRTTLPKLKTKHNKMSYQPLASGDPDDNKSYGSTTSSTEVTPESSPTALLVDESLLGDLSKEVPNPFLDDETASYWKNVYDNVGYECRHVFDPSLTWTSKEERDLVRKLDWKVCLWAVWHLREPGRVKSRRGQLTTACLVCHVLRASGRQSKSNAGGI
jgi:hypothetical protein